MKEQCILKMIINFETCHRKSLSRHWRLCVELVNLVACFWWWRSFFNEINFLISSCCCCCFVVLYVLEHHHQQEACVSLVHENKPQDSFFSGNFVSLVFFCREMWSHPKVEITVLRCIYDILKYIFIPSYLEGRVQLKNNFCHICHIWMEAELKNE